MILQELKQRTRAHHDRVEQRVSLPNLGERSRYLTVLERMYGFYAPLESRLAAAADWAEFGIDFAARRKAALLERDLRFWGRSRPEGLPRCSYLPGVVSAPRAFGAMYVLEGATLGGAIIRRHLRHSLGVDEGTGGAFYASYGEEVGRMWKSFGRALTEFAAARMVDEEIVAGACDTFAALDRWLAKGEN